MPTALLEKNAVLTKLAELVMTTTTITMLTSMEHLFLASSALVCLCYSPVFSDFKEMAN
jgi:hypothetical protein